jgi:ribose transport system permease protein
MAITDQGTPTVTEIAQEPPPDSRPSRSSSARLRAVAAKPEPGALAFLLILSLVLAITQSEFLTEVNLQNIGRQSSVLLVVSVGVLFVLLVGGIDLSIGGMIAFAAVLAAHFADHMPVAAAFAVGIAGCAVAGTINGFLVGIAGFSPIVVTLAMGQVLTGIALLMTASGPIQPTNPHYSDLATSLLGPVPTILVAAIVCLGIAHLILSRTGLGRYVYAVGGSEMAAWLAGIATGRVKLATYAISGTFAGAAGILASSQIGSGDATLGTTILLSAYAAVFLGGVGFGTARGNVIGVTLGALILGVIGDGINLLGLNTYWQYIVSGVLIVLAIALQVLPGRFGWVEAS